MNRMLKFIGIGSAFNTKWGNTSAFIKKNNGLFLFDCGGTVFHRLQELSLFGGVKNLYIVITHTHPDHVGSLGEVIFYCYYILGCKPTVFFPNRDLIEKFFAYIGVSKDMYVLDSREKSGVIDKDCGDVSIEFLAVTHVETIPAYGFIMKQETGTFYYSGDTNNISQEVLTRFQNGEFDQVYQDTCGLDYEGNSHMSLRKLEEIISIEFRDKVNCMHLDNHIHPKEVIDKGFNVVEIFRG